MRKLLAVALALWTSTALAGPPPVPPNAPPIITAGVYTAVVNAPGIGAVPGDIVTPTGGNTSQLAGYLATAQIVISATQLAVVPAVNAVGTTCTGSTGVLTGTTGTGTLFQVNATFSAGSVTGITSIAVAGQYSVNPTTLSAEPVTGASCTGVTLNLTGDIGAAFLWMQQSGSYTGYPKQKANPQASTTGAGTGLTMDLTMLPIAALVAPPNQDASYNFGVQTENFAMGYRALSSNTNGVEDAAFGWEALGLNTTGTYNSAFGVGALWHLTTGQSNVAFGTDSMRNSITNSNDTAIGRYTLGLPTASGGGNVAIGYTALKGQASSTPLDVVAIGDAAALAPNLTTATQDVFIGSFAGENNLTSASQAACIGYEACQNINGANFATAIGALAGRSITGSGNQTFVGYAAGTKVTAASNTFIGAAVGSSVCVSGQFNILIGTSVAVDCPLAATASLLNVGNLVKGDLANFHSYSGGSAPVVSACGTGSPAIDANATDSSGTVTTGAVATTCTVTFNHAYGTFDHCIVTSQSSISGLAYSYTLSAIVVTASVLGGDKFDYRCDGT